MLNYKKKLLNRYPDPGAASAQPQQKAEGKPEAGKDKETSPPPSIENKEVTEKKAADRRKIRRVAADRSTKRISQTFQIPEYGKLKGAVWFLAVMLVVTMVADIWAFWWTNFRKMPDVEKQMSLIQDRLTEELQGYLQKPELRSLVEEKTKLYTEKNLNKFMAEKVDETIVPIRRELEATRDRLQGETASALQDLNRLSSFMMLVTKAKNDDRMAFDELRVISKDRNHVFRDIARQAGSQIFSEVTSAGAPEQVVHYPFKDKSLKLSYGEFQQAYAGALPLYRPVILRDFWGNPKYTEYEKLDFMMKVIETDSSLRALQTACKLVDQKAMLLKPFIAYEAYTDWWKENKAKYNPALQGA